MRTLLVSWHLWPRVLDCILSPHDALYPAYIAPLAWFQAPWLWYVTFTSNPTHGRGIRRLRAWYELEGPPGTHPPGGGSPVAGGDEYNW